MPASPEEHNFSVNGEPEENATGDWNYPEGFDTALRELYERSFEECNLPPEIQMEVLEAFQNSGADAANLRYFAHHGPTVHTTEMWTAGRLDLSVESLALS